MTNSLPLTLPDLKPMYLPPYVKVYTSTRIYMYMYTVHVHVRTCNTTMYAVIEISLPGSPVATDV